jgi:glucokinase
MLVKYYIGIDLGGTEVKIGIINGDGAIVKKDSFKTESSMNGDQLVAYMAECSKKVVAAAGMTMKDITGAGIGSAGLLNPDTGQLRIVTNIPQLNDVFIAPGIAKILGVPAFLDNDVNAMVLGEFYYGAAKGYKDVVAMTLGTGVGGGLIFDGKIYRGAAFTAGEIGHMSIDTDGLYCPCGNYGCLERYIGRDGIIQRFKMYLSKGIETNINNHLDKGEITPRAIAQAAEAGDRLAREVMEETGRILGNALATLVNVLNPEVFVIGGGVANAGDLILEPARREMKKRAYTIPAQKAIIVPAALKNDAGIVGSACVAVDKLSA